MCSSPLIGVVMNSCSLRALDVAVFNPGRHSVKLVHSSEHTKIIILLVCMLHSQWYMWMQLRFAFWAKDFVYFSWHRVGYLKHLPSNTNFAMGRLLDLSLVWIYWSGCDLSSNIAAGLSLSISVCARWKATILVNLHIHLCAAFLWIKTWS